jgi:hypothetical protein
VGYGLSPPRMASVRPAGNFSSDRVLCRKYAPYTASCCFCRLADHSPFSCLIYFLPVSDEKQTLRLQTMSEERYCKRGLTEQFLQRIRRSVKSP